MIEIPLTQGYVTVVDDEDAAWVSQWNWSALVTASGLIYATGRPYEKLPYGARAKNKPPKFLLHRFLLGLTPTDKVKVDHRDLDGLNNQRSNLRLSTQQQNRCNQPKKKGTYSSVFKGVSWNARQGVWHAKIETHGVIRYAGSFHDEVAAALAYDRAAHTYHKEFARLNFPENDQYLVGWTHHKDLA